MQPSTKCLHLAAVVAAASLLTGCATAGRGKSAYMIEPVTIPRQAEEPPKKGVELASCNSPVDLPRRIDPASPRDCALVAAYMGQTDPAEAVRHYLKLIEEHGAEYEVCFTRNAFHEALRCAWESRDPALQRDVLKRYDETLDTVSREPEPSFVKSLRRFQTATEERIRLGYNSLDANLAKLRHEVLQKDRSAWNRKHEDAVVALVLMYRDTPVKDWQAERLDDVALAEVHLADGYVRADSDLLLLKEAEQRVQEANATGEKAMIQALAQAFLERAGVIVSPGSEDYLLGMNYERR